MRLHEIKKQKSENVYGEFDSIITNNDFYNGYIMIGPFKIYMRLINRAIDDDIKHTVDIGSITSTQKTGKFKNVLDYIENSAKINGFDGIYVQSILNEWLPNKLKEYGYKHVNIESGTNMYKAV